MPCQTESGCWNCTSGEIEKSQIREIIKILGLSELREENKRLTDENNILKNKIERFKFVLRDIEGLND